MTTPDGFAPSTPHDFTPHNGKLVVPLGVKLIIVPERELTDDEIVQKKRLLSRLSSTLFEYLPQTSDVEQGDIGDCYLLASLISILEMTFAPPIINAPPIKIGEKIIENMMVVDEDPNYIIVRLYDCRTKGQYIPCYLRVSRFAVYEAKLWSRKQRKLVTGAQSSPWVSAIEQAYAAFNYGEAVNGEVSNANSIDGSVPEKALPVLLGGPAAEELRWESHSLGEATILFDFMEEPFALQKMLVQTVPGASSSPSSSRSSSVVPTNLEWDTWRKGYTLDKRLNWDPRSGDAMSFLQSLRSDKTIGQIAQNVIENIQSQIAQKTLATIQRIQERIDREQDEEQKGYQLDELQHILGGVSQEEELLGKQFLNYLFLHYLDDKLVEDFINYFNAQAIDCWYTQFESYYDGMTHQYITTEVCVSALMGALMKGGIIGDLGQQVKSDNLDLLSNALNNYLKGMIPNRQSDKKNVTYTAGETELFDVVLEAINNNRPVVATSRERGGTEESRGGVRLNHAYSILGAKIEGNEKLIKERNPWNQITSQKNDYGQLVESKEAENWMTLTGLYAWFDVITAGPAPAESLAAKEVTDELWPSSSSARLSS